MPVVDTSPFLPNCAINLALYCQHLGINECSFWGVSDGSNSGSCKNIWTFSDRKTLATYLCEAQEEIEGFLHYYLAPDWVTGETHLRTKSQRYLTDWKHVIAGGIKGEEDVALAEAVDHTNDPATVGPVATTVTDINEIRIYHPDADQEIIPSAITIVGGLMDIEIPRCRMVKLSLSDNPAAGLDYTDLANFETTVDIKRVYNDQSTEAIFLRESTSCSCSLTEDDGCIVVLNGEIGLVSAKRGTYSDGEWTCMSLNCSLACGCHKRVQLNYYSGLDEIPSKLIDAVIRLAHSRMPKTPCGCDIVKLFWQRDINVPSNISLEREKCPFGVSDGAWAAWRIVNQPINKIGYMGVI